MKGRPLPLDVQKDMCESYINNLEEKLKDNPNLDHIEKLKINYNINEYKNYLERLKQKIKNSLLNWF